MALRLAEAAQISTDDLQRGVLEVFVQESPVLDRLPFMQIEGNAYAYNKEKTLPGVAFRGVNEAYPESTGTFAQETETLSILGGDADVDRFIQKTRSDLNDQRAQQTRLKVKSLVMGFQDQFFNGNSADHNIGGDGEPLAWDGLRTRLTGAQVLTSEIAVDPNSDDAARYDFFDELDALVAAVPGISGANGALYMSRAMQAKIRSIGRRLGGVDWIREDMTGKRVLAWQGIPVLDPGDSLPVGSGGNATPTGPILGADEIFAVRFGEDEVDGAVTGLANGGVDVMDLGMLDSKPVYRTRIEFYCGLANFGGQGAAHLKGIGAAETP